MRVYSCSFECTREVCVHARTYIFRKKCTRAHAKIASKSQILEKYSVIPRKKLAKARVSLRASVKLNLSCTVNLVEISLVVLEIWKAEFGDFTVPVSNTLVSRASFVFLATDTLLCLDVL